MVPKLTLLGDLVSKPGAKPAGEAPARKAQCGPLSEIRRHQVALHSGARLAIQEESDGLAADRFRLLRMRLRSLWPTKESRAILLTSPLPGEGKSTVALNLATALAESGNASVLLIDSDLRHPSLSQLLELPTEQGWAECLGTSMEPLKYVHYIEPHGFYFLPSGRAQRNPSELLQIGSVPLALLALKAHFDWIIADSPPALLVSDSLSLAQEADAVLLVAKAGATPTKALRDTIAALRGARVIGVVLNAISGLNHSYGKYDYYKARRLDETSGQRK